MGAVAAWREVLTTHEDYKLNGKHFAGGVADIAKFFDQIRRDLVFKISRAAGMHKGVVSAYEAYINNLRVYNCVVGGIGKPYTIRCGIPQGCPFPMTMVALIMRSWVLAMRNFIVISCYILADDVLIV